MTATEAVNRMRAVLMDEGTQPFWTTGELELAFSEAVRQVLMLAPAPTVERRSVSEYQTSDITRSEYILPGEFMRPLGLRYKRRWIPIMTTSELGGVDYDQQGVEVCTIGAEAYRLWDTPILPPDVNDLEFIYIPDPGNLAGLDDSGLPSHLDDLALLYGEGKAMLKRDAQRASSMMELFRAGMTELWNRYQPQQGQAAQGGA